MKHILGIGNALVDVITIMPDDSVLKKFGFPRGSMQLVDDVKSKIIKTAHPLIPEHLLQAAQLQTRFMAWLCLKQMQDSSAPLEMMKQAIFSRRI